MRIKQILKEEKKTVIGMLTTLLFACILLCIIWQNPYVEKIPFGVLDSDNSKLSSSIVSQLESNPSLSVNYYASSEDELHNAIKEGKINAGVIIPEGFAADMSAKKSPAAILIADGTNMLLGGNAIKASAAVLGTMGAGIKLSMMQGGGIYPSEATTTLGTMSCVERMVYEPTGSYIYRMMYNLIPMILITTLIAKFMVPLFANKKQLFVTADKKTKKELIREMYIRSGIVLIGAIPVTYIIMLVLGKLFHLPLRGDVAIYPALMGICLLDIMAFGIFIATVVKNMAHYFMVYSMVSSAIILTSGIVYPFYMVPDWLTLIIKLINPLQPTAIALKSLNLKGTGWNVAIPSIVEGLIYAVLWIGIGIAIYSYKIHKEKRSQAST